MRELVDLVQSRLRAAADPVKAGPMQAYMKTDMPFYGVPKPQRAIIAREIKKRFPIESARDSKSAVLALWALPLYCWRMNPLRKALFDGCHRVPRSQLLLHRSGLQGL